MGFRSISLGCSQDGLRLKVGDRVPKTKIRAAPFVQIPLGVTEDRLVGTVDIEASMKVKLRSQQIFSTLCAKIQTPNRHFSVVCLMEEDGGGLSRA